jgi:hypothetical protein
MRLWLAILAAALPACGFHAATNQKDGGGGDDDVQPDAQSCFGTLAFDKICFTTLPSAPVMSFPNPINTDDTSMCDQNNDRKSDYCVIAGEGLTVPAGMVVRAYGVKPLVLLATGLTVIHGIVDVSSNHKATPTDIGAGANPALVCTGAIAPTGNSGGYGGSFGGKGGTGEPVDGAPGLAAQAITAFPDKLRGGCPGGSGITNASGGAMAGAGGAGGGAVAIIASGGITIDGTINASGAGGAGGSANRSGGGGGGAGGMIVLDTPTITTMAGAAVFANGGGGAEGGAGNNAGGTAAAGMPGGESTGPTMPGAKGAVSVDGGDGGDGSSGTTVSGGASAVGQSQHDGGGGAGGGGAGVIHAPSVAAPAIAPASTNPAQ